MHQRLDRPRATTEGLGDLRFGQVGVETQHESGPLACSQAGQGVEQLARLAAGRWCGRAGLGLALQDPPALPAATPAPPRSGLNGSKEMEEESGPTRTRGCQTREDGPRDPQNARRTRDSIPSGAISGPSQPPSSCSWVAATSLEARMNARTQLSWRTISSNIPRRTRQTPEAARGSAAGSADSAHRPGRGAGRTGRRRWPRHGQKLEPVASQ